MYQLGKEGEKLLPYEQSAKEVLQFAQEEALGWGQNFVDPTFLLLGLAREEIIRQKLVDLKIDPVRIPRAVEFLTGWKRQAGLVRLPEGTVPFMLTLDARQVIHFADLDARKYKLSEINSTNFLRGIIWVKDTLAAGVLLSLGLDRENMFYRVPPQVIY
ncbi:MAG: hypothetical protein NUV73_02185 [Candidatus Daviesbacteria bacterium]|nr:hypothetical protein [Candidatus Daviesbacteria bacterium]